MTNLTAIGFTAAGGSVVGIACIIAFGIAVNRRITHIAPRCTARPPDTIYSAHPKHNCQQRGNPFLGWVWWTLRLSYDTLLRGVPGTGTTKNGLAGRMLDVNLDGIVLLRFHAVCTRVTALATVLCMCVVLPINLTAQCYSANGLDPSCTDPLQENVKLTDYERTTLANIPPLSSATIQTPRYNPEVGVYETSRGGSGFVGTFQTAVWSGGPYASLLFRMYTIVLCAWLVCWYACNCLYKEWKEALALRRVYYLENDLWRRRQAELEQTVYVSDGEESESDEEEETRDEQMEKGEATAQPNGKRRRKKKSQRTKKKQQPETRRRDPWIPHPDMRETTPNIELYSVLVGELPRLPSEVVSDQADMETVAIGFSRSQAIDWQLAVVSTFFNHCVPNQPGFSSSVAAVTILPDAPALARAWRRWYTAAAALRRLRFIRTLINEKRHFAIEAGDDDDDSSVEDEERRKEENINGDAGEATAATSDGLNATPADHRSGTQFDVKEESARSFVTEATNSSVDMVPQPHVSGTPLQGATPPNPRRLTSASAEWWNQNQGTSFVGEFVQTTNAAGAAVEAESGHRHAMALNHAQGTAANAPDPDTNAQHQTQMGTLTPSGIDVGTFDPLSSSHLPSATKAAASAPEAEIATERAKQALTYYRRVFGGDDNLEVESQFFQALNFGPEQTAVYSRELAQGASNCCPNGCHEERLRERVGIDELIEMEREAVVRVHNANKALQYAQARAAVSVLENEYGAGSNATKAQKDASKEEDQNNSSHDEEFVPTTTDGVSIPSAVVPGFYGMDAKEAVEGLQHREVDRTHSTPPKGGKEKGHRRIQSWSPQLGHSSSSEAGKLPFQKRLPDSLEMEAQLMAKERLYRNRPSTRGSMITNGTLASVAEFTPPMGNMKKKLSTKDPIHINSSARAAAVDASSGVGRVVGGPGTTVAPAPPLSVAGEQQRPARLAMVGRRTQSVGWNLGSTVKNHHYSSQQGPDSGDHVPPSALDTSMSSHPGQQHGSPSISEYTQDNDGETTSNGMDADGVNRSFRQQEGGGGDSRDSALNTSLKQHADAANGMTPVSFGGGSCQTTYPLSSGPDSTSRNHSGNSHQTGSIQWVNSNDPPLNGVSTTPGRSSNDAHHLHPTLDFGVGIGVPHRHRARTFTNESNSSGNTIGTNHTAGTRGDTRWGHGIGLDSEGKFAVMGGATLRHRGATTPLTTSTAAGVSHPGYGAGHQHNENDRNGGTTTSHGGDAARTGHSNAQHLQHNGKATTSTGPSQPNPRRNLRWEERPLSSLSVEASNPVAPVTAAGEGDGNVDRSKSRPAPLVYQSSGQISFLSTGSTEFPASGPTDAVDGGEGLAVAGVEDSTQSNAYNCSSSTLSRRRNARRTQTTPSGAFTSSGGAHNNSMGDSFTSYDLIGLEPGDQWKQVQRICRPGASTPDATGRAFKRMDGGGCTGKAPNASCDMASIRSNGGERPYDDDSFDDGVWNVPNPKAAARKTRNRLCRHLASCCSRLTGSVALSTHRVVDEIKSNSTFAVVTFTNRQAAVAARHLLADGRGADRWIAVEKLPVPPLADSASCDIITCRGCCRPVTLTINKNQQTARKYLCLAILAVLYVFYTVPITFAASFANPDKLYELFPGFKEVAEPFSALLSGIVPAALFGLFFALCPVIFKAIANAGSNATSVVEAESAALSYYWWFMLCTAFSGSSFLQLVLSTLNQGRLGSTLAQTLVEIAQTIPTGVSAAWMNWIILRVTIILPNQYLLQLNTFLFGCLGWRCCQRAVMGGGPGGCIPYRIYVDSGVVFLCSVALGFASPLVSPVSLIYFLVCAPLWRRNCLYIYRPKYDGGGLRWPFLFDVCISSLIVGQILLCTMMVLKEAIGPAIMAAFPAVPTLMFRGRCRKRFFRAYEDAGLLQTSLLDEWDSSIPTTLEKREEFRRFLVDAHKAAYIPVCIAGDATAVLTTEPAVTVPLDYDEPPSEIEGTGYYNVPSSGPLM